MVVLLMNNHIMDQVNNDTVNDSHEGRFSRVWFVSLAIASLFIFIFFALEVYRKKQVIYSDALFDFISVIENSDRDILLKLSQSRDMIIDNPYAPRSIRALSLLYAGNMLGSDTAYKEAAKMYFTAYSISSKKSFAGNIAAISFASVVLEHKAVDSYNDAIKILDNVISKGLKSLKVLAIEQKAYIEIEKGEIELAIKTLEHALSIEYLDVNTERRLKTVVRAYEYM